MQAEPVAEAEDEVVAYEDELNGTAEAEDETSTVLDPYAGGALDDTGTASELVDPYAGGAELPLS